MQTTVREEQILDKTATFKPSTKDEIYLSELMGDANRKEVYTGTAANLFPGKRWTVDEWRQFVHDVSVGDISVNVTLDATATMGVYIPINLIGYYMSDPMDDSVLQGPIADIRSADYTPAMTVTWLMNTCIGAHAFVDGEYANMTPAASLFPTTTTIYYHKMPTE